MNSTWKKVLAFLMAIGIAAGAIPLIEVSAAVEAYKQAPVSKMDIYDHNSTPGTYNIRLTWDQPGNYNKEVRTLSENHEPPLYADLFEISYRNATNPSETSPFPHSVPGKNMRDYPFETTLSNMPLESDSLYEFSVIPKRYYRLVENMSSGNTTQEVEREAEPDSGANVPPQQTALYLTEITSTAIGSTESLKVTWHNPQFNGMDVFHAYDIYYQEEAGGVDQLTKFQRVDMTDPLLIRDDRTGTLTYSITDDLRIGETYVIKVEPVYDSMRVRDVGVSMIKISGKDYPLAYRDFSIESRCIAYVNPALDVIPEGRDMARMTWKKLSKDAYSTYDPYRIEIYISESPDVFEGDLDPERGRLVKLVGNAPMAFFEGNAVWDVDYWLVKHEDRKLYYQIGIFIDPSQLPKYSEVVEYDPYYSDSSPHTKVLSLTPLNETPPRLELEWQALARPSYNAELEKPNFYDLFVDPNITYHFYLSDIYDNLNNPQINAYPVSPSPISGAQITQVFEFEMEGIDGPIPSYKTTLSQYAVYDAETNAFSLEPLVPNKVYFLKVVAVLNENGSESEPAYGSAFVPPDSGLALESLMMSAPPLRVKEEAATENSITIQWETKFVEIYCPKVDLSGIDPEEIDENTFKGDGWYAAVGVNPEGHLVYGRSAMEIEFMDGGGENKWVKLYDLFSDVITLDTANPAAVADYLYGKDGNSGKRSELVNKLKELGANGELLENINLRVTDLGSALYELHTEELNSFETNTLPLWKGNMESGESGAAAIDASIWTPIPDADIVKDPATGTWEYVITDVNTPQKSALLKNNAYSISLRPYFNSSANRAAYYPATVYGSTIDPKSDIDYDPTTPKLYPGKATDMSLEVYWEYDDLYEYELRYSDNPGDYSENGTLITWNEILASTAPPKSGSNIYYTITGLFPDTTYCIWLHKRVKATGKLSGWSYPVEMKTLDIQPPNPPTGLNVASLTHIKSYNELNDTDYAPTEENALNVEWMRNYNDTAPPATSGSVTKGGPAELLSLPDMLTMYMARFDDLLPNHWYYIRAKTVLTVSRATGGGERTYNYIVQISPDEDFIEYTEFVVPDMTEISGNASGVVRKESDWCTPIILKTTRTEGEYDGEVNPEQYPVPTQDWEILYDPLTETLTFRFRSNQTDATGMKDQNADQRFISRLVSDRVYVYRIDLSSYGDEPVHNRVVVVPYSIFKAFNERQITMEITMGDMVMAIAPGTFNTAQVNTLPDKGVASWLSIEMAEGDNGLPVLDENERLLSSPQRLAMQFVTPNHTARVESFARALNLKLKADSRVTNMENNLALYTSTSNTGGWTQLNTRYTAATNTLSADTYKTGTFAAIARATPTATNTSDDSRDAMVRVTSKIYITDMPNYNPFAFVTEQMLNNLVAAVAYNRTSAAMHGNPSAADMNALTKARLLAADNVVDGVNNGVTREMAIDLLTRLYELKTKQTLPAPMTEAAEISGYDEITGAYRTNILKAVDIGFITDTISSLDEEGAANTLINARPSDPLLLGDLMKMLDIIMQDAGL